MGIDCVEPHFTGPYAFDAEDEGLLADAREELAAADMAVWSVHAPIGGEVDICLARDEVHARAVESIVRSARGCAALGGKILVVHCSDWRAPKGAGRARALQCASDAISEVADVCAELGIRVAVENLPPGYLTSSSSELMSVVERFPPDLVGVCVDTGHANLTDEESAFIERCSDRIITIHLHDNDGTLDSHLAPGFGTVDWDAVGAALAASPYDGPLMFEVGGPGTREEALMHLPAAARMIGGSG